MQIKNKVAVNWESKKENLLILYNRLRNLVLCAPALRSLKETKSLNLLFNQLYIYKMFVKFNYEKQVRY